MQDGVLMSSRFSVRSVSSSVREYLKKLSKREKVIILVAGVMVIGTLIYSIYQPMERAFEEQQVKIDDTAQELERTTIALARYAKLKTKRDEIERSNREVEFSEGVLTYIEELLKTKAGVVSNPQINPREPKPFGEMYEQAPVSVRFPIVDLKRLTEFLEELVYGKKPLILSSVEIRRRPAGDSVDVELEVSSLRKVAK